MIAQKIARHTPPLLMGGVLAKLVMSLSAATFVAIPIEMLSSQTSEILTACFWGIELLALPLGYVAYSRLVESRQTVQAGLTPAMVFAWGLLFFWLLACFVLPRSGFELNASSPLCLSFAPFTLVCSLFSLGLVLAGPICESLFLAVALWVLYRSLRQPGPSSHPPSGLPTQERKPLGVTAVVATALAICGMFAGDLLMFLFGGTLFMVLGSAVLVGVAVFILRKMLAAGVIDLYKTPLFARLALWAFAVFGVLSMNPSGGHVSLKLNLLLHVAQLFGVFSLYQMCAQVAGPRAA